MIHFSDAFLKPNSGFEQQIHNSERGFTLIELIAVVAVIAIMMTLIGSQLGGAFGQHQSSSVRRFSGIWQFIVSQSRAKGESHVLLINIDDDSWTVRRQVPLEDDEVLNVDYVSRFRTKAEKERRAKEMFKDDAIDEDNLKKEYDLDKTRKSHSLESQYYDQIFKSIEIENRLGPMLDFPNLNKKVSFPNGVEIISVQVRGEKHTNGVVYLRASKSGVAEFAVIHMLINEEQELTLISQSTVGGFIQKGGHVDYEWTLGERNLGLKGDS